MTKTITVTETKPEMVTGSPTKLLIHIVKRKGPGGEMEDKALCGEMWDHPVMNSKDYCKKCIEIAERDGHDWRL